MRQRISRVCANALLMVAAITFCNQPAGAISRRTKPPIIKLTSQTITLPFGDRTFQGDQWAKLANTHCLLCHSKGMIDTQPPLSADSWKKEVDKMRSAYGCPLRDDQVGGLVKFISQSPSR
jgi:mono/diheme cytochrome c family protein